jgi:hypothetical protein
MLVSRIDIVCRPNLVMNRGGKSHELVKEIGAVPLRSLGDNGKSVSFQFSCSFDELHWAFSPFRFDD